jgi:hypothetical protein
VAADKALEAVFLRLSLQLFAEVFNGFTDLTAAAAESLLHVARCFIGNAFVMEAFVVGQIAGRLLDLALHAVNFAVQFVSIHQKPLLRVKEFQESVRQQ